MFEPNYPQEYVGPNGLLLSGDFVRIVDEFPHGLELPNGNKLIGNWCEVEEYFQQERFYVPRKLIRERKEELCSL